MAFAATFVSGIDDNQAIKNELAAALTALRGARSFSVADLVNPRRAYFQHSPAAAAPVPPGSGDSGFRDLFGREVPTDQFVEQFVAFHGVLGRVDVYQETPTHKTMIAKY
jgi:hypothetical protein